MARKIKLFRLLPATIITAALLLSVKVASMLRGADSLFIPGVIAETAEKPANVSTEKPKDLPEQGAAAKKPEGKPAEEKKPETKGEEKEKKSDAKKPEGEGEGEHKSEGKKEKENPNVSKELESSADHRYTAVEVELLQSLSKRREELDRWENNIQIKEATLEATEKRIEDKIKQIEAMKKQVAVLLAQYNTQEDAKIHSLVKIYENMKPGEAARIFDEVEMPILLLVIDAMAEKKAAPILASMNPKKAKQLTVELANERKINSKMTSGNETPADSSAQNAAPPPVAIPDSSINPGVAANSAAAAVATAPVTTPPAAAAAAAAENPAPAEAAKPKPAE